MYLVQVICIKRKSCELARHGYLKVKVLFWMCYLLSSMVQNWAVKPKMTHPKTKRQNTTAQICPSILCENAEYFCLFINDLTWWCDDDWLLQLFSSKEVHQYALTQWSKYDIYFITREEVLDLHTLVSGVRSIKRLKFKVLLHAAERKECSF